MTFCSWFLKEVTQDNVAFVGFYDMLNILKKTYKLDQR